MGYIPNSIYHKKTNFGWTTSPYLPSIVYNISSLSIEINAELDEIFAWK